MLGALALGLAWAYYSYTSTGGARNNDQMRPLVWTFVAAPLGLFLGWLLARRAEVWRAAFVCFCFYFFAIFVAGRIASFFLAPEEARATGNNLFFLTLLGLHGLTGSGLALWRALSPPPAARLPASAEH